MVTYSCFQCSKDTKMGANHNTEIVRVAVYVVVSNVPKILKWEQITTLRKRTPYSWRCFQCSKDTKMGANHNRYGRTLYRGLLFPMFQRY